MSTKTITVTGQLQGSTIALSFNGGTEVFGTLSDGSFAVNFPQPDGSLGPITFHSATASDFNQALSALQGNTGSVNSQAAAANQSTTGSTGSPKASRACRERLVCLPKT